MVDFLLSVTRNYNITPKSYSRSNLKEYYEVVDEARPLSGIFPTHADFFLRKCISNHETKQASKFQSDPSPKLLHNRRLKNKLLNSTVYFLLSCFVFCISFYTSSVVLWE